MSEQRPREWWINPRHYPSPDIKESRESRLWLGVHVIEYSAYEKLLLKLEQAPHHRVCAYLEADRNPCDCWKSK